MASRIEVIKAKELFVYEKGNVDIKLMGYEEKSQIPDREIYCIKEKDGKLSTPFMGHNMGYNTKIMLVSDFEAHDKSLNFYSPNKLYIPKDFFEEEIYFGVYADFYVDCAGNKSLFQVDNCDPVYVNLAPNERAVLSVSRDLELEVYKVNIEKLYDFWENRDRGKIWLDGQTSYPFNSDGYWYREEGRERFEVHM